MKKPIPPGMSFRSAMARGFVGRIENRRYLDWVKTLPCVSCEASADDPHHPHGVGFKGMGTKVPDYWAIPLCRNCHDALHHNTKGWEDIHGPQLEHSALTMLQAIHEGVI